MIKIRSLDRGPRVCLAAMTLAVYSVQLAAQSGASQLPSAAQVVAGQVDIAQGLNRLDVTQQSDRAIVNWQSFDIGQHDIVMIAQPGLESAMLARVVGNAASSIHGQLTANGRLFLINQNGIVIGRDGVIDTNAFVASTLDVADDAFMGGGGMTFGGTSAAAVVNLGSITARGGNAALLAHSLINRGRIAAPAAAALLIAGTEVFMASLDAPDVLVKANLTAAAAATGVDNSGVIEAAQAQLLAANGNIYDLAVNQSGIVRATGVERRDGRILITAAGGTVGVSGAQTARNADGSGGEILVGGDYRGANANVANASRTVVTETGVIDASAEAGNGGRAIVWADDATRMIGTIAARGGDASGNGGFVEVSGKQTLDFRPAAAVDLTAANGDTGTLLLDPAALTVSNADTNLTSTPGSPFTFSPSSEPATINTTTLANQLNTSNVELTTSSSTGDINFDSNLTWTSNNFLRARSGNNININANITGGASSTLELRAGKVGTGGTTTTGNITQVAGSTITTGTVSVGLNTLASVPGTFVSPAKMGSATFSGVLNAGTVSLDLTTNITSMTATNSGNKIGTFQATGSPGDIGSIDVVDSTGNLDVKLAMLPDSSASSIKIVTPGTLTLLSGTSVGFNGPSTIVLASTGGAFVNNAGASALLVDAANQNKFLIYSSTPAATVKGGLVGTDVSNNTFTANPPSSFSGDFTSRFLFGGLARLTYTADNKTRQYGGADAFTYTVSGLASTDTLSSVVTGSPVFTTTATQSSGVGSYTINIGPGSLASSSYEFQFQPGTLTITPAPLTLSVRNDSRLFGSTDAAFGIGSASGFVNGDGLSSISNLTFGTTAQRFSNVGTYPITASGSASNYTITFLPGTLTVNRAPATVTAPSYTGVYGTAHVLPSRPTLSGVHFDGLEDGFTVSSSLSERTGVGTYATTAARNGGDARVNALLDNYALTFVGGTASITPATVTVRADSFTKQYGDPRAILTYTTSGLMPWDVTELFGVSLTSAAQGGIETIPGDYAITFASAGTAGPNYVVRTENGNYRINRLPVLITAEDITTYPGYLPQHFSATMSALPLGAAPIAFGARSDATAKSGVGTYTITPFLENDTVDNRIRYDFTFKPGTLTLRNPPTSDAPLSDSKVVLDPTLYTNPGVTTSTLDIKLGGDIVLETVPDNVDVLSATKAMEFDHTPGVYIKPQSVPMTRAEFAKVATMPGFGGAVESFMLSDGYAKLSKRQQSLLYMFKTGKLSASYVEAALAKGEDKEMAAAFMGVFGVYAKELISGQLPITDRAQQGFLTQLGSHPFQHSGIRSLEFT